MSQNGNGKANPFEKAIPLALKISLLGIGKKVKRAVTQESNGETGKEVQDTDGDFVTVNKKILDCVEYENIQSLAGEVRTYLQKKKIPGGENLFRSGTYPIPRDILEQVDSKILEYVGKFNSLVSKFLSVYELRKEEALAKLRTQKVLGKTYDLSDENDYPPLEKVQRAFAISYEYISFGPPQSLEGLNSDLYQREMKKVRESCQRAEVEVQQALREMFSGMLSHMTERLGCDETGKKRIFKDSMLTNIKEFLDDFKYKNITNDQELETLVDKCKLALKGKNPNLLRKDEDVRKETQEALQKIKSNMDKMLVDMPSRKITLED